MTRDDLLISWFCIIDDGLKTLWPGQRLRERGPAPTLADSEVITMEVIGEYLGLSTDTAIFSFFRSHYPAFFPKLAHLHRTTFLRQAANLYRTKERLWGWVREAIAYDPQLSIVDSLALHICQFRRAPRCQRFRGQAAFGQDHLTHQPFYRFRLQARVCWPGVICQFELTPGNTSELEAAQDLAEGTSGLLLGDRNFWSPRLKDLLAQQGLDLLAPFRRRKHDPWPQRSYLLSRWRYRIDTIFGQLVERTGLKRIWARDTWHLWNRLLRKVLMHTMAVWTTTSLGEEPLQFARLVA
jgi:hypothetical protein